MTAHFSKNQRNTRLQSISTFCNTIETGGVAAALIKSGEAILRPQTDGRERQSRRPKGLYSVPGNVAGFARFEGFYTTRFSSRNSVARDLVKFVFGMCLYCLCWKRRGTKQDRQARRGQTFGRRDTDAQAGAKRVVEGTRMFEPGPNVVDHPGSQCSLDRAVLSVPFFTTYRPFENLSPARLKINRPTKSAGHRDSQPLKYLFAGPVNAPEIIFPLTILPKLILRIEFGNDVESDLIRPFNPSLAVLFQAASKSVVIRCNNNSLDVVPFRPWTNSVQQRTRRISRFPCSSSPSYCILARLKHGESWQDLIKRVDDVIFGTPKGSAENRNYHLRL
jgi:hypothetical protein